MTYFILFSFLTALLFTGCIKSDIHTKKTINVEVWNYYQGKQKIAFDTVVTQFNNTEGKEKGIYVTTLSIADPAELASIVINACKRKVGSRKPPAIVSVYPNEAFVLYGLNTLVSLDDYFTAEELDAFVPAFLEEGRLWSDGELSILPSLKSSEILYYNKTDWKSFEDACGVSIEDITSIEALVDAADTYYEWTDSLTPDTPNDGKALFGRDSLDNYILFGLHQLGCDIDSITIKKIKNEKYKNALKKLWDHYYVPFVKGRFLAKASYRSTDMKMGRILCSISSSAAANYYSLRITKENDESYDIEIGITAEPFFKDSIHHDAIQQGAGFCILKNNKELEAASVVFLKWFAKKNILSHIAVKAGYIPPLKACLTQESINTLITQNGITKQHHRDAAQITAKLLQSEHNFMPKPFTHSFQIRTLFNNTLNNITKKDRAIVEERLKKGWSLEKATEEFLSEEYFNNWYETLCDDILNLLSYE